jgi:1-acyl-sn-glycerol-3-phosphate acyltransferase
LPFKKGGFIMAIKAGAPIVPVAIDGARAAMKKGSPIIRPVTVRLRFGPPCETAGMTMADRDGLVEAVRGRIQTMLKDLRDAAC